MSSMTNKMAEAGSGRPPTKAADKKKDAPPKKGDHYRCQKCGMEVHVTSDCRCQGPGHAHFHCCGQELQKA